MRKILKYLEAFSWIFKYGPEVISIYDNLTQLFNRYAFEELVKKEESKAERFGRSYVIIVVDIDNLKEINDYYGHLEGDRLIGKTAIILYSSCRAVDLISRYGGDEFVICLTDAGRVEAEKVEERLKNELKRCSELSFSFGISVWREGFSFEHLKKEADCKMYNHKKRKPKKRND